MIIADNAKRAAAAIKAAANVTALVELLLSESLAIKWKLN